MTRVRSCKRWVSWNQQTKTLLPEPQQCDISLPGVFCTSCQQGQAERKKKSLPKSNRSLSLKDRENIQHEMKELMLSQSEHSWGKRILFPDYSPSFTPTTLCSAFYFFSSPTHTINLISQVSPVNSNIFNSLAFWYFFFKPRYSWKTSLRSSLLQLCQWIWRYSSPLKEAVMNS